MPVDPGFGTAGEVASTGSPPVCCRICCQSCQTQNNKGNEGLCALHGVDANSSCDLHLEANPPASGCSRWRETSRRCNIQRGVDPQHPRHTACVAHIHVHASTSIITPPHHAPSGWFCPARFLTDAQSWPLGPRPLPGIPRSACSEFGCAGPAGRHARQSAAG